MKPSATSSQAGSSSTPRRVGNRRIVLVVAGIVIGLAGVLLAMFETGVLRRPAPDSAAPDRAAFHKRAPSSAEHTPTSPASTERNAMSPPALPQAAGGNATGGNATAEALAAERPSARNETRIVRTQIKLQKYVEEAYPAWHRAHPGQECPRQVVELTEYIDDKDANDAWGRPLKMRCGEALGSGARGIRMISLGRDGERSEDDIKFGE